MATQKATISTTGFKLNANWAPIRASRGGAYWAKALVIGALGPSLVAWFVVLPIKGMGLAGGWDPKILVGALVLNGAWCLGVALLMRKMPGRKRGTQPIPRLHRVGWGVRDRIAFERKQSQRDCGLQPKVARNELPWVAIRRWTQPQRGFGESFDGYDSIPHVFLIPFDFVFAQQRAQLVLEPDFAMMPATPLRWVTNQTN